MKSSDRSESTYGFTLSLVVSGFDVVVTVLAPPPATHSAPACPFCSRAGSRPASACESRGSLRGSPHPCNSDSSARRGNRPNNRWHGGGDHAALGLRDQVALLLIVGFPTSAVSDRADLCARTGSPGEMCRQYSSASLAR